MTDEPRAKLRRQEADDHEHDLLEALASAMEPVLEAGLAKLDDKATAAVGDLLARGRATIRVTIDSDGTFRVRGDLVLAPDLVALGIEPPTELFTLVAGAARLH
jgi:hypothetical protein